MKQLNVVSVTKEIYLLNNKVSTLSVEMIDIRVSYNYGGVDMEELVVIGKNAT